ncbi:hypothetical protein LCGC14_0595210 [marine sediment metagenome]|uniref:Uncharacterized protein n=1 Tax=marine sediment metagenome TaxID=412755 RepID=A0A0F9RW01_9ZZZZ
MTTTRIGRVTRRSNRRTARAGQVIGRMGLSVPAGTLDPNTNDRFRIMVTGWSVRNDGGLAGFVSGHIIVQRRGGFLNTQEISIIEGDWIENADPHKSRLRTRDLNVALNSADPRRAIVWSPFARLISPGTTSAVGFSMVVGMDLVAGDQDLDIVAIIDRLPEASGIAESRSANAFSVGASAPNSFNPIVLGQAGFQVNPF